MIRIVEKEKMNEGAMLTVAEFCEAANNLKVKEVVLNTGVSVMWVNPKAHLLVYADNLRLVIKYSNVEQLTVLLKEIKGIERTSACFFIKTKKNEDIWLKF